MEQQSFRGRCLFLLGDKDDGISCVEPNVDFGFEENVSGAVLAEMKNGQLDALTLYALKDDIQKIIEKNQTQQVEAKTSEVPQQSEETKQASTKRHYLTWKEIERIVSSHGALFKEETAGLNTYMVFRWGFLNHHVIFFNDNFEWKRQGFFGINEEGHYITYSELRENPEINESYLRNMINETLGGIISNSLLNTTVDILMEIKNF